MHQTCSTLMDVSVSLQCCVPAMLSPCNAVSLQCWQLRSDMLYAVQLGCVDRSHAPCLHVAFVAVSRCVGDM